MGEIKNLKTYTYIDLFSGCGGISLGFKWAGLREVAAIDFEPSAITVFRANFPEVEHAYCEDLREFPPEVLSKKINMDHVDIIVGGPPCQGFSTVRQRDGSNSGIRLIEDNRRDLYKEFLKYVKFFQPKIFVIENVPGMKTAAGGHFFNQVQSEARSLGYIVHSDKINAWEYGVPQKRIRRLIIGTKNELGIYSMDLFVKKTHSEIDDDLQKIVTLGEAIGDLPPIPAGGGADRQDYVLDLRKRHLDEYSGRYIINVLACEKAKELTAHKARPQSARDLRDFSRLREGENSDQAIKRGEIMEFPYNRDSFKDRYTRQSRFRLCSTILAHLSKDGLMFIHPTQNRSITPREAARIQSFPDTFLLPTSRTNQFKLLGNAVPPLVGLALGKSISNWLNLVSTVSIQNRTFGNEEDQTRALQQMLSYGEINKISEIPTDIFRSGWHSIHYFLPYLHPSSALENGDSIEATHLSDSMNNGIIVSELLKSIYKRSGWPVKLVPYAKEAYQRFMSGSLDSVDYYWSS